MDTNRRMMGLAIATTAAALFVAGLTTSVSSAEPEKETVKVKCYGTNACKGKGECKTATNQCKGQNACKGKSFENMTERACIERHGRT